jgi:hypothetical protein
LYASIDLVERTKKVEEAEVQNNEN